MILPTKHLRSETSLIYIGGIITSIISSSPHTVDQLWYKVKAEYFKRALDGEITYDWFVLALSMLYTIGAASIRDGRIVGEAL